MTRATLRIAAATAAALGLGVAAAGPAGACGGLVGENGSITLTRTTTLAAWHDGVEHYVTAFDFTGEGESVGSIIPLPGVPDDVVAAGEWTLQRLQIEVQPPQFEALADAAAPAAGGRAEVLLETQIDALDITVLRGGGDEVGEWALENGFFLTPDAPEILDFYAQRSPIFLAARFDAQRAAEQGLVAGQGTPIHVTIPLDQPWVPLRILGLGADAETPIEADVFLLTDEEPDLLAGGRGLQVARSEQASDSLMADLRSDRGMEWMPEDMWLTHLTLDEAAGDLGYDLSVGAGGIAPSELAAGLVERADTLADEARPFTAVDPAGTDRSTVVAVGVAALGAALLVGGVYAQRRAER